MLFSSVLYVMMLLFLESIHWQRLCENTTMLYYKVIDWKRKKDITDDDHPENGRYKLLGLFLF